MTPDQYRREGADVMRAACVHAVNATASPIVGTPYSAGGRAFSDAIRAIDVDEVLARLPPAPDAVARLVEAVKNERHHKSAYDATPPDRGWQRGPKGQAYVLWCEARADVGTALAAMEASHDRT